MSIATVPRAVSVEPDPQAELHGEVCHVRDLVFVRDLLRERGASANELRAYESVIDAARAQLADSAKRASARFAAAA